MSGKKLIYIIIIATVLGLFGAWLFGEIVIKKYDLERAMTTPDLVINYLQTTFKYFV